MSEKPGRTDATAGRFSDDGKWWWDGRQWSATLSEDGRWRWDGEKWQPTDATMPAMASGTLLASAAAVEGMETPRISPDARRLAWIAPQGRAAAVVLDGQPLGSYDKVHAGSLAFSPDSRRLSYGVVRSKDQHFVVVDGQESGPYQRTANFIFSADSNHHAFMAKSGGQWHVVRDRVPGTPFDNMYPPDLCFSRDSDHVAYLASRGKQNILVVDSTERLISCDHWLSASLALSGDGARVAAGINRGKKSFLVVDAIEHGPYDTVLDTPVTFSPSGGHLVYAAKNGGRAFVVRDGKGEQPYDSIATTSESIAWSAVGDRLAYVAGRERQSVTVVDGGEWEPCDGVAKLAFSPDGRRLAVVEQFGKSWSVVIDRVADKKYLGVGSLVFDPTGEHLAYLATTSPQTGVLVRDGEELTVEGAVISPIIFDSGGALHYVELRPGGLYLVERS